MEIIHSLPHLQALLNTLAASLLGAGYYFIRQQNRSAHRACMIGALIVSVAFFTSYLIYHARVGYIPFPGQGVIRPIYFTVLGSHVILAFLIVPVVLVTVGLALKGRYYWHRRIARWTLPAWLYVSVSGVLIYLLSYGVYQR